MLNVVMLSVVLLNVIMLSVVLLNVIVLSVVLLNVIMLSVVAPFELLRIGFQLLLTLNLSYGLPYKTFTSVIKSTLQ